MASLTSSKWTAEVAIDESLRSSLAIWSLGRVNGAVTVLDVEPGAAPMSDMTAWLHQRSVGGWRLVERERVSGRVSLVSRGFEFEQIADAKLFAAAWTDAIIQLRVASLDREIAHLIVQPESATGLSGRGHYGSLRLRGAGRLDVVLTWLLDVVPVRLRARSLRRLQSLSERSRIEALVTPVPYGQG